MTMAIPSAPLPPTVACVSVPSVIRLTRSAGGGPGPGTPLARWRNWVAVGRQCLVETLTADAGASGELADVAGACDNSQRLGDLGGVVVAFVDHSLELRRCVIEVRQVVGSVEGREGVDHVSTVVNNGTTELAQERPSLVHD